MTSPNSERSNSCSDEDFLPFECNGCGMFFCKHHRSPHIHCCMQTSSDVEEKPQSVCETKTYICCHKDCSIHELVEVRCPYCEKNFCLKHRHQQAHTCEKLETIEKMTKTAELVKQIQENQAHKIPLKVKGAKSKKLSSKVTLMKLKQRATGDNGLTHSERIYLNVVLPRDGKEMSSALFFSIEWSVGKALDYVAAAVKLANYNNTNTEKKLQMYSGENGIVLPLALTLRQVGERKQEFQLCSGSTVILEYTAKDCALLEHWEEYVNGRV
ncbi:PREDICTED: AN1-type zinc finger protein 1-like [Priapulus caudatus]|uniref:AN1-type zinc finger protein 1-like n=1 Tax=Priapulus caudatus TaxID=37621 RepID=A0ABM1EGX3_PRICU|nr:PREDICTED: AN1-type zinc finger protein 1-like [Priapulus caudatus]XP_014671444.1 PREDICTED: AN1-type zinc finger protein 1-like [Priapulus caudatus]